MIYYSTGDESYKNGHNHADRLSYKIQTAIPVTVASNALRLITQFSWSIPNVITLSTVTSEHILTVSIQYSTEHTVQYTALSSHGIHKLNQDTLNLTP